MDESGFILARSAEIAGGRKIAGEIELELKQRINKLKER